MTFAPRARVPVKILDPAAPPDVPTQGVIEGDADKDGRKRFVTRLLAKLAFWESASLVILMTQ